jgi:hypothetical protein
LPRDVVRVVEVDVGIQILNPNGGGVVVVAQVEVNDPRLGSLCGHWRGAPTPCQETHAKHSDDREKQCFPVEHVVELLSPAALDEQRDLVWLMGIDVPSAISKATSLSLETSD